MRSTEYWRREKMVEHIVPMPKDFDRMIKVLCEKALEDAKSQLHPLLRNLELDRLDQRDEFILSFKNGLEHRIAGKLASWQPEVQAVFKYEETQTAPTKNWDGSIRLLIKVARLSNPLRVLGKKLDSILAKYLRQKAWQRFQTRQSVLEVHQVTLNELRHGIGYGAMFLSVYNAPTKVWPQNRQAG